jgi:hypothetical protein
LGETAGAGKPDTARGAGDDRNLALQAHVGYEAAAWALRALE